MPKWTALVGVALFVATLYPPLALAVPQVAFKSAATFQVGAVPRGIAVADFNGDGIPDLAVIDSGDNTVSILLGKGDGSFQPSTTFNAGGGATLHFIATADFNGDNRPDLVVTGSTGDGDFPSDIRVFLGNGDGSFQAPRHLDGGSPFQIVVADFNSDNKPDLFVTNGTGVGILLGNGDGSFQSRVDYTFADASGQARAALGDFNRDNIQDIAVGTLSGVAVLLGKGDGTFHPAISQSGAIQSAPNYVRAAADFDHDGNLDLLVDGGAGGFCGPGLPFHFCGAPVALLLGHGDGTFHAPMIVVAKSVTFSAVAADFNGDGIADIGLIFGGAMQIYLGDGKSGFTSVGPFSSAGFSGDGTVADLNRDGAPDIVMANRDTDNVAVILNNTGSDFSISASPLTPNTLSPGQSATSTVSLKRLNAFDYSVSLACSVQSLQTAAPTCSLSPKSVTFNASGTANTTLTISAGSKLASLLRPSAWISLAITCLPLFGVVFLDGCGVELSRKKRLPTLLISLTLFSGILFQSACGGGTSSSKSTTYTITITGTSGAMRHSTIISVSVT